MLNNLRHVELQILCRNIKVAQKMASKAGKCSVYSGIEEFCFSFLGKTTIFVLCAYWFHWIVLIEVLSYVYIYMSELQLFGTTDVSAVFH